MSAAATAAGYLYASGRLRAKKEEAERAERGEAPAETKDAQPRRQIKVAVYQPEDQPRPPSRQPRIQYKTRRWKPE